MAISIGNNDLDDDGDFAETHEINVTPFIDVILVLLAQELLDVRERLVGMDVVVDLAAGHADHLHVPELGATVVEVGDEVIVARHRVVLQRCA